MKLPFLERSIVPEEKITDYLLSSNHPDGKHKAAFFTAFGFNQTRWLEMAAALLSHVQAHEVTKSIQIPFGMKYIIEGDR